MTQGIRKDKENQGINSREAWKKLFSERMDDDFEHSHFGDNAHAVELRLSSPMFRGLAARKAQTRRRTEIPRSE